ncbi:MAG: dipeptide ABC transporter ATP-binding protein [Burkholderiaceae bacterium]
MSQSPTAVVAARDLKRNYTVRMGILQAPASLQAVGGISFSLHAACTLAVVGESGCGKSTLARLVAMIEPPTAGELQLGGIDAVNATGEIRAKLRQTVQLVFQNPYGSLNPRKTIGSILAEPLAINTSLSKDERRAKVDQMMRKVGLRPEHVARYPHMFSGGQRQRIAIARALMLRPALVVADEPVSALDVSIQAQVLNLLADLQREFGVAYLFISHDLAVVRHIADDVLVMYLGLAMEQGPKSRIFGQPLHPYTQALLASTPGLSGADRRIVLKGELPSPMAPPPGCVFSTRCPYVTDLCRAERPALRPLDGRLVACHYAEKFLGADVLLPVRESFMPRPLARSQEHRP